MLRTTRSLRPQRIRPASQARASHVATSSTDGRERLRARSAGPPRADLLEQAEVFGAHGRPDHAAAECIRPPADRGAPGVVAQELDDGPPEFGGIRGGKDSPAVGQQLPPERRRRRDHRSTPTPPPPPPPRPPHVP